MLDQDHFTLLRHALLKLALGRVWRYTPAGMVERRKLPRYIFGSAGQLTSSATHSPANVSVLILSAEGALVESGAPLAVGERCTLNFTWAGSTITVNAQVRSRERTGNAGLMFLGVEEESRKLLQEICAGLPPDIRKTPENR